MSPKEYDYRHRRESLVGPLLQIADTNPVVHHYIEAYCHGRILVREEMLSQLVLVLTKDWDEHQRRLAEMALLTAQPMFASRNKE